MELLDLVDRITLPIKGFLGFSFIGLIGFLDFMTGYEATISIFYLLPVSFLTWFGGFWLGGAASLTSSMIWCFADFVAGQKYTSAWILFWNTIIRLSFFQIIVWVLTKLQRALNRETTLARTDQLTGAINSRFFYELTQMEINRLDRFGHVFTLAYLDLDNFKQVNDQWGHSTGDKVLCSVVRCMQHNIRQTDFMARLGGDEFALLLPETGAEKARVVCAKIQRELMEDMKSKDWPVTFSIGVLTCETSPDNVDELVNQADRLMYSVKHGTKNAVQFAAYSKTQK